LPSETIGGRLVVSELVTARPPTVASDHSLRHAGAGAARSRVINDRFRAARHCTEPRPVVGGFDRAA